MLRTRQQHPFFSELQSNLIQSADANLTKLNRNAVRELQRLGRPGLSNAVYNESGDFLRVLSIRMLSAVRIREDVHIAGRQQKPDLINVTFGSKCQPCEQERFKPRGDNEAVSLQDPKQDFAEITSLLALTYRTEEWVARLCRRRVALLGSFFAGTSRLMLALVTSSDNCENSAPSGCRKLR